MRIKRCKSFQDPKADPGPWLILAHFAHPTPLRFVGKISGKLFGFPHQILDPLLNIKVQITPFVLFQTFTISLN